MPIGPTMSRVLASFCEKGTGGAGLTLAGGLERTHGSRPLPSCGRIACAGAVPSSASSAPHVVTFGLHQRSQRALEGRLPYCCILFLPPLSRRSSAAVKSICRPNIVVIRWKCLQRGQRVDVNLHFDGKALGEAESLRSKVISSYG